MRILVTGASGAVGHELAVALDDDGHDVLAATRAPEDHRGPGLAVRLDLDGRVDADALRTADVAYYLVHALDRPDYAEVDRRRAESFAEAWGSERTVVYLGGLGPAGTTSAHLESRHEVGEILRRRCRAVELRASLVLGPESTSFRLLRALSRVGGCSWLPTVIPVPRSARTKTQPIAQGDLTRILVDALDLPPGRYDVGGPEAMSFAELVERGAAAQGRHLRLWPVLPVDGAWLGPPASVVADTDARATVALFGSMGVETVVDPARAPRVPSRATTGVDDAIRAALA